jgi:light-regulated signal transduction histidine kinase (bacteriophytochrome)
VLKSDSTSRHSASERTVLEVVRRQLRAEIAEHQKAKTALSEASAELQTLSYTLGHDLRAPLRAMNCFAHLVLREEREHITPDSKANLERVMSATERMDALLRDLLAWSRVRKEPTQIEAVDLDALVTELLDESAAGPPPRADLQVRRPLLAVRGHRGLVGQCLAQLLENARDSCLDRKGKQSRACLGRRQRHRDSSGRAGSDFWHFSKIRTRCVG